MGSGWDELTVGPSSAGPISVSLRKLRAGGRGIGSEDEVNWIVGEGVVGVVAFAALLVVAAGDEGEEEWEVWGVVGCIQSWIFLTVYGVAPGKVLTMDVFWVGAIIVGVITAGLKGCIPVLRHPAVMLCLVKAFLYANPMI